jgi:4-amino-4-deoxy-L-arabinose transferase-like glycosyltransferase
LTDKALLTSLPAIATLAALALPTLKRSLGALIDWFTLLFFSLCALAIWVVWVAMQTGTPAKPAANVTRLAPEFVPEFSMGTLALAILATLAWAALVKWRTGYHRAAIWKSMVLPAGGAVLCWLLLTTLWLPLLNYARSYAPLVQKVTQVTGPINCIQYAGISKAQGAAFMHHAQLSLMPMTAPQPQCNWLILDNVNRSLLSDKIKSMGWIEQAAIKRPTDKDETLVIFRAATAVSTPTNKATP